MGRSSWALSALAIWGLLGCSGQVGHGNGDGPDEDSQGSTADPSRADGGFFNADDDPVKIVDGGRPGVDCVDVDNDEFGRPRCQQADPPTAADSGMGGSEPDKPTPRKDAGADDDEDEDAGRDDPNPPTTVPVEGPCQAGGICQRLLEGDGGQLDLLFVIDNSGSMAEEQALLRAQFPRMVTALTTGDLDGDGQPEFAGVPDIQLGVVSTDMGLGGLVTGISGCTEYGDDGVLIPDGNRAADPTLSCAASYPTFLSFQSPASDPVQTASDFACVAALGTQGCGFEQTLEAALKAITPATEARLSFLGPPNMTAGHGDGANAGFVRPGSLLAVVLLTDEDDCSASNPELFRAPQEIPVGDPREPVPLNLRCAQLPGYLYDHLARYVGGFPLARASAPERFVFGAIVGVPVDTVTAAVLAQVDFSDLAARDAHYQAILDHPQMQLQFTGTTASDTLVPSCSATSGQAYPPRRIVEVAKGLGEASVVQSICQDDFTPVIDAIVGRIGRGLGSACLPRTFTRGGGRISCDVTVELAPVGSSFGVQHCRQIPYLRPLSATAVSVGPGGGEVCRMNQVQVLPGPNGTLALQPGSGWYYDEGSTEAMAECSALAVDQRVALTADATIPVGATAHLDCAP